MRWGVVASVALVAGCFEPGLPGDLRCGDGLCPVGLVCDNGFCRRMLTPDGAPDAPVSADAADAGNCVTRTFQDGENGYGGTQDTRLREATPNMALGNIPEAEWDDDSGGAAGLSVALIRFDDIFGDGDGQIPIDAAIEAATLRVEMVNESTPPPGSVHEAAVSWTEATTFNTFGAEPGVGNADRGPAVAEAPVDGGPQDIDLTGSVKRARAAAEGDNDFFGWLFLPAAGNTDGAAFATRESADPHPLLTVRFCR